MALSPELDINGIVPNVVIRQNPFPLCLDTSGLFMTALVLVLGLQILPALVLTAVILILPFVLFIRNDFLNFLLLGPGGTPPTFIGYTRLSSYRLFSVSDVLRASPPDRACVPSAGILEDLPRRHGARPQVAGLAPQRQLNQPASMSHYLALKRAIGDLTHRDPQNFKIGTSTVERHGFALFARNPITVWGKGEIAHIHDADKSLHLQLHGDDIKEVIQKGWGERHPLGFQSVWRDAPVPHTFVMVYAPRDEEDAKIICKIIEAAAWFHTAQRIEVNLEAKS